MFDDMSVSIMVATAIIFLVMILVLNATFYKPLLRFMDDRDNSIRKDEAKVRDNSQETLGFNDELKKIQKATREEIQRLKQNAIEQAKQEVEQELKSKREELEKQTASFYADLQVQRQALKEKLMMHLPELKQTLAESLRKG